MQQKQSSAHICKPISQSPWSTISALLMFGPFSALCTISTTLISNWPCPSKQAGKMSCLLRIEVFLFQADPRVHHIVSVYLERRASIVYTSSQGFGPEAVSTLLHLFHASSCFVLENTQCKARSKKYLHLLADLYRRYG